MSMYLSLSQLEAITTGANVISRENLTNRYFYDGKKPSVFLSHKHSEIAQLKRVAYLLEQLDSIIYVDWLDWACTVLGGFIAMLFWLIV